ncbi:hypothetical protein [Bdellovibrio sp. HCB209]|uniref:hypothetical protein n=1 Tax=Bdellovibrio sp. HCB209 TaxID=3394354 RepID=UPI0039B5BF96
MRNFFFAIILIALGPSLGFAEEVSVVGESHSTIEKIVEKLPSGETKQGLQEYLEILGLKKYNGGGVGISNRGLQAYFDAKFGDSKNSCVRVAALSFYQEVAKTLKSQSESRGNTNSCEKPPDQAFDYGCSESRPRLSQVAGQGEFKGLSPGWVWQLALKHAKGDPNSAMFLIGLCGHDDASKGTFQYKDFSEAALDDLRDQRKIQIATNAKVTESINELSKNYDANREDIEHLKAVLRSGKNTAEQLATATSVDRYMACPPKTSGYYVSQSLGKSVDIAEDLKSQIIDKQKFVDNAKNTPGKYYHVYGAAFMACHLVQNGISTTKASFLQQQAARFYRGMRMCDSVKTMTQNTDYYKDMLKKYKVTSMEDLTIKSVEAIKNKKIDCKEADTTESMLTAKLLKECSLVYEAGYNPDMIASGTAIPSVSDIRKKLAGKFRNSDAAELYKSWYLGGGKTFGQDIPCTDIRVWGPNDLMKPDANFFDKLSKPSGWAEDRYRQAAQKLSTWDDDFKWTIAQHKVGAEFAGKNCKKRAPGEKPLKGICPQGPPDGVTQYDLYEKSGSPSSSNSVKGAQ